MQHGTFVALRYPKLRLLSTNYQIDWLNLCFPLFL